MAKASSGNIPVNLAPVNVVELVNQALAEYEEKLERDVYKRQVHIRHLREKIEINPSDPRYLKVVWGQGYKMEGGKP